MPVYGLDSVTASRELNKDDKMANMSKDLYISPITIVPNESNEIPLIPQPVDAIYMSVELICAVVSIIGNFLVILVFAKYESLRTITNYYVISLAVADLLVGLIGIPAAIATSVGLPYNFQGCLFMNSFLMLLCTTSIFSLLAVSVDRFWAIMHPLTYPAKVTQKKAILIIGLCWIISAIIGLLPSMGWNKGQWEGTKAGCFFLEVMDLRYLAFINFATIVAPTLFMAVVYAMIYRAVHQQLQRMSTQMLPRQGERNNHLRAESKAAKSLAVIVLLFVISWLPLYTLNTVMCFWDVTFKPEVFYSTICLSHFNSAWNPMLYAWGMADFKNAFRRLFGFGQHRTLTVV